MLKTRQKANGNSIKRESVEIYESQDEISHNKTPGSTNTINSSFCNKEDEIAQDKSHVSNTIEISPCNKQLESQESGSGHSTPNVINLPQKIISKQVKNNTNQRISHNNLNCKLIMSKDATYNVSGSPTQEDTGESRSSQKKSKFHQNENLGFIDSNSILSKSEQNVLKGDRLISYANYCDNVIKSQSCTASINLLFQKPKRKNKLVVCEDGLTKSGYTTEDSLNNKLIGSNGTNSIYKYENNYNSPYCNDGEAHEHQFEIEKLEILKQKAIEFSKSNTNSVCCVEILEEKEIGLSDNDD